MTPTPVAVDDLEVVRRILSDTEALLLDFDGPICSVFAGIPAHYVASHLRQVLISTGHTDLPPNIRITEDPFDVFRYASSLGDNEAQSIELSLKAHEVEAVQVAAPTVGAHELIHRWNKTGRKIAIVSNNSTEACKSYLERMSLTSLVAYVSARESSDPNTLKPNPHLILRAINAQDFTLASSTLIGDSLSDLEACNRIGVRAIGYANKKSKLATMSARSPAAIATRMTLIARAIHS